MLIFLQKQSNCFLQVQFLLHIQTFPVNTNDTKAIKKAIQNNKVNVNSRDPIGRYFEIQKSAGTDELRTALQIAAFSNSVEAAALLLQLGARISPKLSDGRTALHIASGNHLQNFHS